MRTANTHRNMARCAATATLACVLGLGLVAPAYADTASDLAAARTKLEQIGTQTQQIHDELSAQTQELDQTAGEITQKQQEIAEGQAKLSSYVAGEYKTGGLSLLQVLTGVDDLGDMLNRLFYYGKVSDKQAQTIQEVKDLKQQLTDKQAEQEKNVAATQKKVDELNAQQAEAQNVVNSLDSQLQAELAAEAIDYRGCLYGGFMLTPAGPKVLEFNARFGDPETQVVLPRLKNDLVEVMLACANCELDQIELDWRDEWAVAVVLTSAGYPGSYEKGKVITGIADAEAMENVTVYHAGTAAVNGQLLTNGGRVLAVTALGDTFENARNLAYEACEKIDFEGKTLRHDIGLRALRGRDAWDA